MPASSKLTIDVISDVVCPWCYIGKRLLEQAIASKPDIPVEVRFRPYFLNPWVPREGMSRADYASAQHARLPSADLVGGRSRQGGHHEATADGNLFQRRWGPLRVGSPDRCRSELRHGWRS